MKIYIAGKITGLKNYKEIFNKAEENLKEQGHQVMNPSVLPKGFPWESYMPICFAMINACDGILMLKNWEDSKGAGIELEYAIEKGKEVLYE